LAAGGVGLVFNGGMTIWKLRKYYPAGLYFITMNTFEWQKVLIEPEMLASLRRAVALAKGKYPFENHAWVVMPDHMHFVIRTHHVELGRFIGCFKSHMTRDFSQFSYKNYTLNNRYKWRRRAKRGRLWHLRFYDHRITDQQDYERCVKYCLYNPVKHGYTATAWDWPYSTLRSYIKQGKYPERWKYLTGQ
jgi:putative transposase